MRLLVCGSRDYANGQRVYDEIAARKPSVVIHGAYRGADTLADEAADRLGIERLPFPADWTKHGKKAGPLRNQRMLDEGKPDLVLAFPGHTGTADMKCRARENNIPVIEIN